MFVMSGRIQDDAGRRTRTSTVGAVHSISGMPKGIVMAGAVGTNGWRRKMRMSMMRRRR